MSDANIERLIANNIAVGEHPRAGVHAVCNVLVDDEQYTAVLACERVRVLATDRFGEVRFPMMTPRNSDVWQALVAAIKQHQAGVKA